jgi:hypothetical protein
MLVPAFVRVKDMIESDAKCIRQIFRNMIASKFVAQSLGQEAGEEALEKLYDEGFLKFSSEPGPGGHTVSRVLLYDQGKGAYTVTNQIKFELEKMTGRDL